MRNTGLLIVGRAVRSFIKNPMPVISGLGMSLFFLVVYDAGLGGIGKLPEFQGAGYMAFLLPMGIISLVFGSSAGSAQALSRDIASGYFFRLALAPVPRRAFVIAAITADALGIFVSVLAVIGIGALLGAPLAGGIAGVLAAAALVTLFGSGISALSAALVMKSGKVELAQTVGMIVFMLLFLAPTFVPRDLMGADWLRVVATVNPLTYIMDTLRELLSGIGHPAWVPLSCAIAIFVGFGGTVFALRSVRSVLN